MKKSQGEIFGVALMFVVIVIGIILYAQIKANAPPKVLNTDKEKYELLAQSAINSLLKMSTTCYTERNKGSDSVLDLILYCQNNYLGSSTSYPVPITCDNLPSQVDACTHSLTILNDTLNDLFTNETVGPFPFVLEIDIPEFQYTVLSNATLTNFKKIKYKNSIINQTNYRKLGYNKASSGIRTVPSVSREINFVLSLYYR